MSIPHTELVIKCKTVKPFGIFCGSCRFPSFSILLLALSGGVLLAAPHSFAAETKAKPKAGPNIVKKQLTITCSVTPQSKSGVVLAQGGDQRGYALYLQDGKPVFAVRQNGKIYTAASKAAIKGRLLFKAHLAKDGKMTLMVNGKSVATGKAPGLFAMQPKDGLSVGQDSNSAVGTYKAPNALKGKVEGVKIDAQ